MGSATEGATLPRQGRAGTPLDADCGVVRLVKARSGRSSPASRSTPPALTGPPGPTPNWKTQSTNGESIPLTGSGPCSPTRAPLQAEIERYRRRVLLINRKSTLPAERLPPTKRHASRPDLLDGVRDRFTPQVVRPRKPCRTSRTQNHHPTTGGTGQTSTLFRGSSPAFPSSASGSTPMGVPPNWLRRGRGGE